MTFVESECIKIDARNKQVVCADTSEIKVKGKEQFRLDYDHLVVAVGAEANTFGTPGVREYCHFLKVTFQSNLFFSVRSWDSRAAELRARPA